LWRRTLDLADLISRHRAEIAGARRLPDVVAQAFVDADIYRLLVPRDMGGGGIGPIEQFDLVEEISSRDASAGWNYAVGSGLGIFAGFLPRAQAEVMFSREGAAMAGSGAPQGKAHRVEGGYRIEGTFGWASGIDQAHWVYGGCFIHADGAMARDDQGRPMAILAFIPKAQATVHDSWRVNGLVATNSTQFTLDGVFVPEERSFRAPWQAPLHPSPLFRLPKTFFGYALTGVPLGVARATVEALRALGPGRALPRGGSMADGAFAQYAVAKAEALVESARLLSRAGFAEIWETVLAGGEASPEQCARSRRACVHAAEASL
jgi:alkylation response protein AidB-like acyl-CoA dehydrogenase